MKFRIIKLLLSQLYYCLTNTKYMMRTFSDSNIGSYLHRTDPKLYRKLFAEHVIELNGEFTEQDQKTLDYLLCNSDHN